jgi:hypothetical protein
MVADAVGMIESGTAKAAPQDERCATWEPSFDRQRLKRNDLYRLPAFTSTRIRCADCEHYTKDDDGYLCLCGMEKASGKKMYVDDYDSCRKAVRKRG